MIKFLVRLLSTFFYTGYLPFIPGTFGSMAGIFLIIIIRGSVFSQLFLTILIIVIGFLVSGRAEEAVGRKDPSFVVIDEVSGMLLSLLFIPYDIKILVIAFVLFRILDTLKPFPSGRLERYKGSIGIMADDLIAGLYTNLILQAVLRVISFKAS